jgi:23S rRNA (pseudouridine1915-N3)-methyltransferase
MLITIVAVGKLKAGPERLLFDRFSERIEAAGRKIGFSLILREVSEGRASSANVRKDQEAAALLAAVPRGAVIVALDEGGKALDSRAFATRLTEWRDNATDVVFAIGGADGHGDALLRAASLRLAFGAMTWPHQLVRVMLAEQVYRAVTIVSGHPYHRD